MSDAVSKSYVDKGVVGGLTWLEPVDKPGELANLLDPDGSTRLCLWNNYGYVKDGPTWIPFGQADTPLNAAPVHTNAVDRLADITRKKD